MKFKKKTLKNRKRNRRSSRFRKRSIAPKIHRSLLSKDSFAHECRQVLAIVAVSNAGSIAIVDWGLAQ